ncbi:MAG: outer membrane beta-barrel family protein [Muribaculaceae bacterium]|nr:outer membrane beta-barrel family protein [Muribaculaceae bacterium]
MKKLFLIFAMSLLWLSARPQNEHRLQDVTIVASRTTNNAEGYITNLRGTDIAKGKPAADVLSFLPNISRENGSLKINGLTASEIYVDGVKLSDLSELDDIPGEMIDKVQVKYLAGADGNASHSGGTIMISLRHPPEGGYYGSVSANANWQRSCGFGNERISGMINYRYKGLSVYDNLFTGATKVEDNSEQSMTGQDLNTFLTETSKLHRFNYRNRLSLTQQLKSGSQLGGCYVISLNRPHRSSVSDNEGLISSVICNENIILQEGTLRYKQPLPSHGSHMELTADYLNRHSHNYSTYFLNSEKIAAIYKTDNLNLWKFKADVIYPHSSKFTLKFGASAQFISSKYTPTDIVENDRFETSDIPSKTSGFTPIVYASAQGSLWKLKYSAGVNWQLNRIFYEDLSVDCKSVNTQWQINPTIQVMMPFGSKMDHALMLNYKRILNDIPYSAISSVIKWSDAYNYSVGNPDLKAQSVNLVMAGLSLLRNKISLTVIYSHSYDEIYWQTFQSKETPEVFYTKPINIDGQEYWGLGAEWIESPTKWWRFKLSGRIEIRDENTTLEGIHYNKARFKEYFYFNNNFRFGHGWGGMLNADFEPTFRSLDRTYHAVYYVKGNIYKTFLNDNLQIAIDFSPLGNRRKLDRCAGENKISYKYTTPVQYVGFSLRWNFSGGKKVDVNVVNGIQDYQETTDNR